jgi:hypothetical protein
MDHSELDHAKPQWITLNWTMPSQNKAFIAKVLMKDRTEHG